MQCVGYSLAGPRLPDHNLRQREDLFAAFVVRAHWLWLADRSRIEVSRRLLRPAPDLADWLIANVPDHEVVGRVRDVGVETPHERLMRLERIARRDRVCI